MLARSKIIVLSAFALLAIVVIGALFAELTARILFGFSTDVPVYILDKDCEYRIAPGSYDGPIEINAFSMRSDEVPEQKPEDEYRVMLLGDSVIHGGGDIPQQGIASSIAEETLNSRSKAEGGPKFRLLNCSSGSWSAINQLGYVKKYGLFDADAIILVWNTGDASDSFGSPSVGEHKPVFRLQTVWAKIKANRASRRSRGSVFNEPGGFFAEANASALNKIIDMAQEAEIPISTLWHADRNELQNGYRLEEAGTLLSVLTGRDIPVVRDAEAMKNQASNGGNDPLADSIHLSAFGHEVLAELLVNTITERFENHPEQPSID